MRNVFEAAGISQSLTLIFDINGTAAIRLATHLAHARFPSSVASTCTEAVNSIKDQYYASIVIVAELGDAKCVECLHLIRRRAIRSWLVIVSESDDQSAIRVFHQCGGDALVKSPFTVEVLVNRLAALSRIKRPV
jgi:DNA-binding response OmpR family regulator